MSSVVDNGFSVQRIADGAAIHYDARSTDCAVSELHANYQRIAKFAKIGYWEWDEVADRCIYCSEYLASLHGVDAQEYLRVTTSNAADRRWVHPADLARVEAAMLRFRETLTDCEIEYTLVRADGSSIDVCEVMLPILDSNGQLIRSMGYVQDISERKIYHEELQRSQERFIEFGARASEVYWILSADWRQLYYISPSYRRVFGRSCESVYRDPLSWMESVHHGDREALLDELQQKTRSEENNTKSAAVSYRPT